MSDKVRAKKHLGQHFLKDEDVAFRISESLGHKGTRKKVIEIGPGMGVLTKYLINDPDIDLWVCEIDTESVAYLKKNFPSLKDRIIEGDFLELDLEKIAPGPWYVIGNFPYNISSQILFRVLEQRELIPVVAGMFQKEVAERIAAGPGSKATGILSVLLQAYYNIEYLFTVHEHVFDPPPKVKSGVIRIERNNRTSLPCNEKLFTTVVKTAFNQRRKTLRNSMMSLCDIGGHPFAGKRAEQLSVEDFIELTNFTESNKKQ